MLSSAIKKGDGIAVDELSKMCDAFKVMIGKVSAHLMSENKELRNNVSAFIGCAVELAERQPTSLEEDELADA